MNQGALANLDIDSAIDRLASGTLLRTIAAEHQVDKSAVYRKVCNHPLYPQAIREQAESLVEQATAEAFDPELQPKQVNITRVRLDAAHKWAAARDPERWAPRQQQVVIAIGGNVESVLLDAAGALLAKLAVSSTQQTANAALLQPIEGDYVKSDNT